MTDQKLPEFVNITSPLLKSILTIDTKNFTDFDIILTSY